MNRAFLFLVIFFCGDNVVRTVAPDDIRRNDGGQYLSLRRNGMGPIE